MVGLFWTPLQGTLRATSAAHMKQLSCVDDLTTTNEKDKIEHSIRYLELLIDRLSSYDECNAYIRILKEHIEDYRHPGSIPRAIMD